jgi:ribonuclease G
MTRQRVRASLYQSLTRPCPCCTGTGRIFTAETIIRRIERALRRIAVEGKEKSVIVRVHPEVALYILEQEPAALRGLERETRLQVHLRDDPLMQQDEIRLTSGTTHQELTQRYALG